MRKTIMLALATTMTAVAIPAAAYYWPRSGTDPLADTLRGYGFLPINPPSTLMNVGSLYYVDPAVKEFKAICHADKTTIENDMIVSRSWDMQENLQRNGHLTTSVKINLGSRLDGDIDNERVQKVHSSMSDVLLEELPLGANWLIFAKLMEKPECNMVAMQVLAAGGYVCQGQKLLKATVEFKIDTNAHSKMKTDAKAAADDIKGIVKVAIETQSGQSVVEREGRLFAGSALDYGVAMNPTCLAPPNGHFQRILPKTAFGRLVNYVLFSIVEPMLPAKSDRLEVAQDLPK
jgi:hypothetical protein